MSPPLLFPLFSWLVASPIEINNVPSWIHNRLEPFNLQVAVFPGTGRGLQTTTARAAGDVLIAVSEGDAITASSIFDRYPLIKEAAHAAIETQERKLTDEQVLAWGLLKLRQEQDVYVSSLPEQQHSVLFMPPQLKLCVPRCYQQLLNATCTYAAGLYDSLCEVQKVSKVDDSSLFSRDDFLWAFATVRSRSVGLLEATDADLVVPAGGGELRAMLPAFDLLNHRVGAKSSLEYSFDQQQWSLVSGDVYQPGDQVFISYGDERDNLKMLLTYGFCVGGNPQALAFFDTDDLLRACSIARPNIFPPEISGMLRNHFSRRRSKLIKTGNDLAMFAYDGSTSKPAANLAGTLAMIKSLAEQLLSTAATSADGAMDFEQLTTSLEQDVLECLIRARQIELSTCLYEIDGLEGTLEEDGWENFLSSIRVLVEDESSFLL